MRAIFNFFSEILDKHDLKSERIFVQTKALLWTKLSGKPSWKYQNYAVNLLNVKQRNLLSKAKKSSFRNWHIKKKVCDNGKFWRTVKHLFSGRPMDKEVINLMENENTTRNAGHLNNHGKGHYTCLHLQFEINVK